MNQQTANIIRDNVALELGRGTLALIEAQAQIAALQGENAKLQAAYDDLNAASSAEAEPAAD